MATAVVGNDAPRTASRGCWRPAGCPTLSSGQGLRSGRFSPTGDSAGDDEAIVSLCPPRTLNEVDDADESERAKEADASASGMRRGDPSLALRLLAGAVLTGNTPAEADPAKRNGDSLAMEVDGEEKAEDAAEDDEEDDEEAELEIRRPVDA